MAAIFNKATARKDEPYEFRARNYYSFRFSGPSVRMFSVET